MTLKSTIEALCKIRHYSAPLEITLPPRLREEKGKKLSDLSAPQEMKVLSSFSSKGEKVFFEYVETFDQENYLNIMNKYFFEAHPFKIVIFFIKQKKMKIQPHSYIENLNLEIVHILLQGHKYVPQFFKLSACEWKEMDARFGQSLPQQLVTDPVSRLYDFEEGDIVKIVRKDGTPYYRRICAAD